MLIRGGLFYFIVFLNICICKKNLLLLDVILYVIFVLLNVFYYCGIFYILYDKVFGICDIF